MPRLTEAQRKFVAEQEQAVEVVVATYIARHPDVLLRHQRTDLMQEARLGFIQGVLRYHAGIQATMQVYAICAARNAVRFCASRGRLEVVSDADVPENATDDEPSLIGRVLSRLPEGEQRVITLIYGLNGTPAMSVRKAAAAIGCHKFQVQRMKKRAEANLARYRDDLIPEPEPQS